MAEHAPTGQVCTCIRHRHYAREGTASHTPDDIRIQRQKNKGEGKVFSQYPYIVCIVLTLLKCNRSRQATTSEKIIAVKVSTWVSNIIQKLPIHQKVTQIIDSHQSEFTL